MTIHSLTTRLRSLTDSRPFIVILFTLFILLIISVIFEAGVLFGMHEARLSYRWGENYAMNFGGPRGGFMPMMDGLPPAPNGHGAFGQIATTTLPTFIITDPIHPEESIRVGTSTIIKDGANTVTTAALTRGTYVVVLGTPDAEGSIDASLIRIMPAPGMMLR